jgi:hypothetical protein
VSLWFFAFGLVLVCLFAFVSMGLCVITNTWGH